MNRITYYLITLISFMFSVLAWTIQPLPVQAQIRGADSQEFFEQGNEQMEQNIQELEQGRQKKEEQLDETLNIQQKKPNDPKVEDVASPSQQLGLDDNEPVQPTDEEAEIKF